jgi:hypothetical protein
MSTWRCGWICQRSYFFAAAFQTGTFSPFSFAGAFFAGLFRVGGATPPRLHAGLERGQQVRHILGDIQSGVPLFHRKRFAASSFACISSCNWP